MSTLNAIPFRSTIFYRNDGTVAPLGTVFTIGTNGLQSTTNSISLDTLTASTMTSFSTITASTIRTTGANVAIGQNVSNPNRFVDMRSDIANSMYFDFHSSDSALPDYSTRIQSLGGATTGTGALNMIASTMGLVASSGVGIGTTSPTSILQVFGTGGASTTPTLTISNNSNANTGFGAQLLFTNFNNPTTYPLGQISALRNNNAGDYSSYMSFHTNTQNTTSEKMRILPNGNIGIGVTNPSVKLHIIGTPSGSTNSFHSNVEWGDFDASSYFMMGRLGTDATSYNSGAIYLYQNGFSTTAVTLSANGYSFMNGGNVGIGTTQMISTAGRLMVYAAGNGVSTTNWIAGAFGPSAALPRVVMGTYSSIAIIGAHSTNLDAWANLTINPGANVSIPGTLSKGGGSFDIHHPLSSDAKDRLVHSFVEGPRCDLIYRGRTTLVNGTAVVDINKECTHLPECAMDDGTFEALCANAECFLQNKSGFGRVIGSISGATLTITAEHAGCNDTIVWMVIAERVDPFIKTWDRTNSDGYLVTQYTMDYEPLNAATNYGLSV